MIIIATAAHDFDDHAPLTFGMRHSPESFSCGAGLISFHCPLMLIYARGRATEPRVEASPYDAAASSTHASPFQFQCAHIPHGNTLMTRQFILV
jgi:hypothetical protein